jgi:hypothetical protein
VQLQSREEIDMARHAGLAAPFAGLLLCRALRMIKKRGALPMIEDEER